MKTGLFYSAPGLQVWTTDEDDGRRLWHIKTPHGTGTATRKRAWYMIKLSENRTKGKRTAGIINDGHHWRLIIDGIVQDALYRDEKSAQRAAKTAGKDEKR